MTKQAQKTTAKKAAKAAAKKTDAAKASAAKKAMKAPAKKAVKTTAKAAPTKKAAKAAKSALAQSAARAVAPGGFVVRRSAPGLGTSRPRSSASVGSARIDRAVGRYRELLQSVDQELRVRLIDAVTPDADVVDTSAGLDEALWGPAPSEAAMSAAELEQLRIRFDRRRNLAAHSVSREDAAGLLDISSQAVTDHLHHGNLTGLKDGKRWLIPLWQFDADSERGFLPGIADVAAAFPGGVVSLSRWMTAPNPNFDDLSPRDAMASGDTDAVIEAAAALTAAGW